ncbi:cadherin-23-like [Liolophura sinensis]|uniref:cadherin-23-like n=1 Tax=Liolophura sinensis TaxID=3198878 RepID=UPI0031588A77
MTGSSILCSNPMKTWIPTRFLIFLYVFIVWTSTVQGNNPPRLVSFDGFAQAKENAARGTLIKTITATDADGPNEITFEVDHNSPETQNLVYLGNPNGTSTSGRFVDVFLNVNNLDRDSDPPERNLRFAIRDGVNNPVYASMTLFIQDVNDEVPQFRGTPYRASISEDAPNGTLVFNGTQTVDPDTGIGGSVSYSLELTDEAYRSTFRTTPYQGHIYLNGTLDYEKHNFYQLQLTATDGGGLNTTTDVIITIEDVQDTKPSFVNTPYTTVILENATIGTSVISVSALDGDRGNPNPVTYRFVNYSRSDFNIDANTGEIKVNSKLNSSLPELRNQGSVFDLIVEAKETVAPGQMQKGETSATMLVLITVQDVNDHAPEFGRRHYNATVPENAQRGIPIQLDGLDFIKVKDLDQNDYSRFKVSVEHMDGQPFDAFIVRPSLVFSDANLIMLVENNTELDYERLKNSQRGNVLEFKVKATETSTPEKRSGEANFTVYVTDENDNFPQFDKASYVASVKEHSAADTTVVVINATDEDSGLYGEVTFSLQRGGDGKFRMKPDGTVVVENGTNLDREKLSSYYLTVEAKDRGGNRNTSQLIINLEDINDQAPVFLRNQYSSFVTENEAFPTLSVSASDGDMPSTLNSEVLYNLSYVPDAVKKNITITTEDGQGNIKISPNLDFEELPQELRQTIMLEVTATDKGLPPLSTTVNVTITVEDKNDNPPVLQQSNYQASIFEDAPGGKPVVNISATDADGMSPNNEIQYSIASGGQDKFLVNPGTGELEVAYGASFDRDIQSFYNLTVVARDKGFPQLSSNTSVTISILDVNNKPPEFKDSGIAFSVQENATDGTVVGSYTAMDKDTTANLTYDIMVNKTTGIDESGSEVKDAELVKDYFSVKPDTGEIIVVSSPLDRETAEVVKLTVRVRDKNALPAFGEQTATGTVTVTLLDYNDNAPEFSKPQGYSRNVSEREVPGYEILTVSAIDKDKDQRIEFELSPQSPKFSIDRSTGKVTLSEKLDREKEGNHTVTVIAYDSGTPRLSSNTTVTINVLDENDNNPQFVSHPQEILISEDSHVDDSIFTFRATDLDSGKYAEINYHIEAGNADQKFRLNSTTGELFVNSQLDREIKAEYQLRIEARDNYQDPEPINRRSNVTTFTVKLSDVNDNSPVFNSTTFYVTEEVREDRSIGSFVYTITATDKDAGSNGSVSYELSSSTNATNATDATGVQLFRIEPSSGKITVAHSLTDTVGWRFLTVIAKDGGSPQNSASATVLVEILDVNVHAPNIKEPNGPIYIKEGTGVGASVYNFTATDKDEGKNGEIDFELITSVGRPQINKNFTLDRKTGALTTKINLDYETRKEYTLYVQAKDNAPEDQKSSRIVVHIYVIDEDDNPPKFDPTEHPRNVPKEFVIEENKDGLVGKVTAFDADSTNTSNICYCFVGDHDGNFDLDRTTGEIRLLQKIDRETTPGPFSLVVKALQNCNNCNDVRRRKRAITPPPWYNASDETMLWITVNIKDVNDNKPVFKNKEISVGITRDTQYGEDIISLSEYVTDEDEAENNKRHNFVIVGEIKATLDNLGEERAEDMFKLSPSGVVKTNTYFKANWFGFFSFNVLVADSAGNSSADVKIYLINKDQQVKIVILGSPDSVNKSKTMIVQQLENVTEGYYHIIVDKVRTHEDIQGKPDPFKTDLFIHGVEKKSQRVLDGDELLGLIDSKIRLLIDTYKKYSVVEVVPAVSPTQGQSEEVTLKMVLILVAVLLSMLVIVLGLSFFFCRKKYKRKLRAATAMAFVNTGIGAKEPEMNKMDMPGTNLHAFEGSNPIWMEKYDNLGLDDNNSQNSLDANEIEASSQNQFDEQEVSLDLYNDDYENFAAIKEHEASKNNRNKDIVNNNADKYAVNGSVKYTNGSVDSLSSFNTKNVNGLQTTEI